MLVSHGMAVVALVTLALEAACLHAFGRPLGRAEADADADAMADPQGWPRRLLDHALINRLSGLFGQGDINDLLDDAADESRRTYAWRWWPYWVLAFVPPLLGLLDGWKNLRGRTNAEPIVDIFLPWPAALVEAGLWLALATWLAHRASVLFDRWRSLSGRLVTVDSLLLGEVLGADALGTHPRASAHDPDGEQDPAEAGQLGDGDGDGGEDGGWRPGTEGVSPVQPLESIFDELLKATEAAETPGEVGD
jgi:hypothetical protein